MNSESMAWPQIGQCSGQPSLSITAMHILIQGSVSLIDEKCRLRCHHVFGTWEVLSHSHSMRIWKHPQFMNYRFNSAISAVMHCLWRTIIIHSLIIIGYNPRCIVLALFGKNLNCQEMTDATVVRRKVRDPGP